MSDPYRTAAPGAPAVETNQEKALRQQTELHADCARVIAQIWRLLYRRLSRLEK